MTSRRNAHVENVRGVRAELLGLLDGMDYCLDWKPEPSAWSARQVAYQLLDSPPGGMHQVLWGMLSGDLDEFELWSDLDNMTPERLAYDLEQIREDIGEFFLAVEEALESVAAEDFDEKSVLALFRSRGTEEVLTVQVLLERFFDRHWRGHLGQLRELRLGLGL